MKRLFVRDLRNGIHTGQTITLLGWIRAKRDLGNLVFADICDSTGCIQAVARPDMPVRARSPSLTIPPSGTTVLQEVRVGSPFDVAKLVKTESAVKATGQLVKGRKDLEIQLTDLQVVGEARHEIFPRPRSDFDPFDSHFADHLLSNRHLYLRNPKVMAILRFRHLIMGAIHNWFRTHEFVEITAPVLTALPLYDDGSAVALELHDEKMFLTQCVGYYLEAAAHAFENVYNIGPSFRGEESKSKRHLMEYWHIKAEMAWVDLDDVIHIVESLISHTVTFAKQACGDTFDVLGTQLCQKGLQTPYPRITYEEAGERIRQLGMSFTYGQSLASLHEVALSRQFFSPFWITGIPRAVEPFPYCIDPQDPLVTRTADLIATDGYGELLGTAEKIHDTAELDERMTEKGKFGDKHYEWIREVHELGCVPHGAFGMGVERFLRWLLGIPHVRDTIPFPRTFRRRVYP